MANRKKSKGPSKAERLATERRRAQRRNLAVGLTVAALAAVVAALVFIGGSGPSTASKPGEVSITLAQGHQLSPGESVPAFSAPALHGGTFDWTSVRGKPTVLAVWAPWCPHCQKELPILSEAVARHSGVQMVSVATSIDQAPGPSVDGYMSDHHLTFPVGIDDASNTLGRGLGVSGFPTVYYVASDGTVMKTTVGEVAPSELDQILSMLG